MWKVWIARTSYLHLECNVPAVNSSTNAGNGMGGIMPNWCSNHLTVKGERNEVQRFKEKAVGHNPWDTPPPDEKPTPLNFHSLVPIPENILRGKYENAGY